MTAEDFLKDPEWININMRCIEIWLDSRYDEINKRLTLT